MNTADEHCSHNIALSNHCPFVWPSAVTHITRARARARSFSPPHSAATSVMLTLRYISDAHSHCRIITVGFSDTQPARYHRRWHVRHSSPRGSALVGSRFGACERMHASRDSACRPVYGGADGVECPPLGADSPRACRRRLSSSIS